MNKSHRLFLIGLAMIGQNAYADQLDGLKDLGLIFTCLAICVLSLIVAAGSSIYRFTRKAYQVNLTLNLSAFCSATSALLLTLIIGNNIDPGFLTFCLGVMGISVTLMILNYSVGRKSKN